MHDTVVRIRKLIHGFPPRDGVAALVSTRLQSAGLSRALCDPLAAHFELLYQQAHQWVRVADAIAAGGEPGLLFGELHFASRGLRSVLGDLLPFLERAENNLSGKEEITHRESSYEREVAPFSRMDSTADFKAALAARSGLGPRLASEGAQVLTDLLKIVYLENRLHEESPKPSDLYAMVSELVLDGRRHLMPVFEESSEFMVALRGLAKA